ncbi:conserved exported hypothetical protein [Paraburkholderia piptadeniae]|uniref:Lysozyme inhibitor LprI-like N-terminal domain-containing protein n=1 Tax=Paraburkholderia piptadeniae TaxID=1701573 RepID=A0A1N7SG08_9BURK|nr:lysozyme inhibitor LprI family protein [Paraburkholderia piptadeniae]SIT45899.1 conserved exported hypothetical protein [Paraburkholderia piptadeniae]
MRHTDPVVLSIALALSGSVQAETIYSGEFDYRTFQPSSRYFAGHAPAEIAHLCDTGEHASTADMEQCAHAKFERAEATLLHKFDAVATAFRKSDSEAEKENEPLALPHISKARSAWINYRDETCYSVAYKNGPASSRYVSFWECMTTITQAHTKELDALLKSPM